MGFNNWAGFECNSRFGEKLFLDTADALVRLGLDKLGYDYVNIDDCWMQRDRDANGNLQVDTTRFPGTDPRLPAGSSADPLKALGDYLHSKGLKFGIYEDAGYQTCQGAAGSYGHFQQDADQYASWGVDYLKLDYCYQPLDQYPHKTRAEVAQIVYTQASQALQNTGRPIVFSASAPAYECCSGGNFWQEFQWLPKVSNLWRFGSDISDNWASVMENYTEGNTPGLPEQSGPGAGLPPSTVLTLSGSSLNSDGQPTSTTATLTDNGSTATGSGAVTLSLPEGWTAQPASRPIGSVAPGGSATASFTLSPPAPPKGRASQTLAATATYTWNGAPFSTGAQETVVTDVPYDDLAEAFNNVGITDETDPTPGNFDGDGNSYSAQALAAGDPANPADPTVPGSRVSVAGATFTWPDVPAGTADNVAGGGVTVKLSGQGGRLAFLGAEAGFVGDTVTVHYTDGTTSSADLGFPNWCCTDPTAYGAQVAFYGLHRDTQSGPANAGTHYQVFYNSIPITSSKTVASVTLPKATQIHIFDMVVQQ